MTIRQRLTPLLHITVAALLNMVLYLLLSNLWRAVLNDTESSALQILVSKILVPLVTCLGFAVCLCFLTHIRRGRGEDRVLSDYRDCPYGGIKGDLRMVLSNERIYLITIAAVILACVLFRGLDRLMLGEGEKLLTTLTVPYLTMDLFATSSVPVLGELISVVLDAGFYLLLVLLYRRRAYRRWHEGNGKGGRA